MFRFFLSLLLLFLMPLLLNKHVNISHSYHIRLFICWLTLGLCASYLLNHLLITFIMESVRIFHKKLCAKILMRKCVGQNECYVGGKPVASHLWLTLRGIKLVCVATNHELEETCTNWCCTNTFFLPCVGNYYTFNTCVCVFIWVSCISHNILGWKKTEHTQRRWAWRVRSAEPSQS